MHTQAKPSHSNQLLTEKRLSAKNYSPLNVYLKTSKSKSIYKDSHVKTPTLEQKSSLVQNMVAVYAANFPQQLYMG